MAQYRTFANRHNLSFYAGTPTATKKLEEVLEPLVNMLSRVSGVVQALDNTLGSSLGAYNLDLLKSPYYLGMELHPDGRCVCKGIENAIGLLEEVRALVVAQMDAEVLKARGYVEQIDALLVEARKPYGAPKGGWEQEYGRWYDAFREVMSDEEWEAASRSSLNAHYTPAEMCHQLWGLAQRVGFRGGRVFEPGCGVGNFMGAMPESVREGSFVSGVELDSLSARLAAKIYPENQIELTGIEDSMSVADNTQDLVVGNVPFSDTAPSGQREAVKLNLHNLCISKSIDKLRPGGVAILVSSHSTLDHNDSQRQVLAAKSELVGAIRLPSNAFARNANTEVVTDILVLRKPAGIPVGNESWQGVEPIEVEASESSANGNRLVNINEYFCRHPEMMLGQPSLQGKMYGQNPKGQFTVKGQAGVLSERLAEAFAKIPENILSPANEARSVEEFLPRAITSLDIGSFIDDEVEQADGSMRRGIYVIEARREGSSEKVYGPPPWRRADASGLRGTSVADLDEMAAHFIRIRHGFEDLLQHDLSVDGEEDRSAVLRERLRSAYSLFVLRYGALNTNTLLKRYFREDPAFGSLMALETSRVEKAANGTKRVVCEPAEIFTQRTVFPVLPPSKTESLEDAIYVSLAFTGAIDLSYISVLSGHAGMEPEALKRRILATGLVFENPETGILERREQYLSGNIFEKLAAAEARVEATPQYEANVKALRSVVPARMPFDVITTDCGAPWVGEGIVGAFLCDITGSTRNQRHKVLYVEALRKWAVPDESRWYISRDCEANYQTARVSALDVIKAAINDTRLTVKDKIEEALFREPARDRCGKSPGGAG